MLYLHRKIILASPMQDYYKKHTHIIAAFVAFAILGSCEKEVPYVEQIERQRLQKDYQMRNSQDSPFYGNIDKFKGLDYFAPDEKYKIEARFVPWSGIEKASLRTSDNKSREYFRYGHAEFQIKGSSHRLVIFQPANDPGGKEGLFLGFGDATSANETYGAGRYLDVTHSGGETIVLDFNLAYNPYCAYTDAFSCPIPPKENFLTVPIPAGEKDYKLH